MQESLNNVVYGDGTETIAKTIKVYLENATRNDKRNGDGDVPAINKGVGVPGVLKDQNKPSLPRKTKLCQIVIQESSTKIYEEEDPDLWDWTEIRKKMAETYELQRDEIVEHTRKLVRLAEEEGEEVNEDEPAERAMVAVKQNWPFLFFSMTMNDHHKRLTGINLQERLEGFLAKDQLRYLPMFFSACSSKNTLNCVLKLKAEENGPCSYGGLFLLTVCMAANHFNECYKKFLFTAEVSLG